MKNFTSLIAVLFLVITPVLAQIEKGSFMLGGNVGYNSSSINDVVNNSVSLAPNVSYFFIDRLATGLVTPYSHSWTSNSTIDVKSTNYSIGPMVRYYFPKGQWAIFPEVIYSWGWNSARSENPATTFSGNSNYLKAGAGITYFVNKNIGVEGVLSYQRTARDLSSSTSGTSSTTTTGMSFQIGLQIYLPKVK